MKDGVQNHLIIEKKKNVSGYGGIENVFLVN
jgi:hypothetical protein